MANQGHVSSIAIDLPALEGPSPAKVSVARERLGLRGDDDQSRRLKSLAHENLRRQHTTVVTSKLHPKANHIKIAWQRSISMELSWLDIIAPAKNSLKPSL